MDWHTIADATERDVTTLETATLDRIGMPREIVPRYRSSYFQHIFSGGTRGLLQLRLAEVLDADAFQAFKEKGLFDPATASSFRHNVLDAAAARSR